MSSLAPVMFLSHGSPMFAIEPGSAGNQLRQCSTAFDHVAALLVISPHWCTDGSYISSTPDPQTLHDFGGFPQQLYQLQYPAPGGGAARAKQILEALTQHGFEVRLNDQRGLDHGAWVPLMHLRPAADIPVLQLSLNIHHDPQTLVKLGESLSPLRQRGIAVLASGGVTHNLMDMRLNTLTPAPYAERFQGWLREQISERNIQRLLNPHHHARDFGRAHPTPEHYLPLLVAMGATTANDRLKVLPSEILYSAISMESYLWQ